MDALLTHLLTKEFNRLSQFGYPYSNKPYSCGRNECLTHFKGYKTPANMTIERTPKDTTITIKPLKGTGKRKPYIIHLWI